VCLKEPNPDSCMEVVYSNVNVDNQDLGKPTLPAILSSDITSMLL